MAATVSRSIPGGDPLTPPPPPAAPLAAEVRKKLDDDEEGFTERPDKWSYSYRTLFEMQG